MEFKEAPYVDAPQEWLDLLVEAFIRAGVPSELAKDYVAGGAWGDHYAEGLTPDEAVEEDRQYWEAEDINSDE